MKHLYLNILLATLISMMGVKTFAYDIEVANADGVTIYYNWINNRTELAVSYKGNQSRYDYVAPYSGNIVIPDSVDYKGKTYSVTQIGDRAFSGCRSLTSVTIPNSVTTIGLFSFSSCSGITSVTIPNSVTEIGSWAFQGCSGLTFITIPSSVTSMGFNPFSDCSSLTSISVEDGNPKYDSREGCNAIISRLETGPTLAFVLVAGCMNTTIPNNVTQIANSAFSGCSGLTSIAIPESVEIIVDRAFYNCIGLTSITIPNSVTHIFKDAFHNCISLTSITIPNSVTSIGDDAFWYCTGLTSITIPNSVTNIGNGAFYGCSGLTSITIPNSITSIGHDAFNACSGLTSITVEDKNPVFDSREGCNAIIKTNENRLIAGCINSIIPNSVTSIGDYAFKDCTGLTSITIPNSVTSIGNYAFFNCTGITSITIPNSVTSIGNYAFYGCNLTSVSIGNSISSIERGAFSGYKGLTDVYCYAESVPTTSSDVFNGIPFETAILHVPETSLNTYKTTDPWSKFGSIVALTNQELGVECARIDDYEVEYYQLNGRKSFKPKHGLNIIRAKDGKTKKILVK